MQANPVAKAYAEALLELGRERGEMDAFGEQLTNLAELLQQPDLRMFFAAPMIEPEAKKKVLEESVRPHVDPVVLDFLCLLVDKGRIMGLDQIAETYRGLADEVADRQRVWATTALPLPDDLQEKLQRLLNSQMKSKAILESDVDPGLLGGMILRVGDKVYDGSVRGQLKRVSKNLMRSSGYEN